MSRRRLSHPFLCQQVIVKLALRGQSEITHLPTTTNQYTLVECSTVVTTVAFLVVIAQHQLFPRRVNIPAKIRKSRAIAEHETCTSSDGGVSQKRVGHF